MRRHLLPLLACLAGLASLPAPAQAFVPPPFGKRPAPLRWTGTWTSSYGPLVLSQEGANVVGSYVYSNPPVHGTVQGTAKDGTLDFVWTEGPGGAGTGSGVFTLDPDGRSFKGSWVGVSGGGGLWEGTRAD